MTSTWPTSALAAGSLSMSNPHAWSLADLPRTNLGSPKVMTTFSCGGGSSLGYKLAGCDVIAANDIDAKMETSYRLNLHPKHYFRCPVSDLLTQELPPELYKLDILDGSPPCSTFSMSGNRESDWGKSRHFREGQTEQVLSELFFDFLNVAEHLRPRAIVAENVRGLLLGNAKGYVRLIVERFREIGYAVQVFLVDSADCGVPQHRERVFFCARREDVKGSRLQLKPVSKHVSVIEACSDLQVLTDAEVSETRPSPLAVRLWPYGRQGESFATTHKRLGEKEIDFSRVRVAGHLPSCTLTSECMKDLYHWSECRKLTLRELTRLGSFPDDYVFTRRNPGGYIIGMSVPPRLMQFVATEITRQWLS